MFGNYYGYPQQGYYAPNGAMPDVLTQYKGMYQQVPQTPTQPMQPTPMQPAPPQTNSDMTWVQGEAGAKAYIVAPGRTVTLWDSESPMIYLKSTDTAGVPRTRMFELNEIIAEPQRDVVSNDKKYVTFEDLNSILDKKIESRISELSDRKDDADDE